MVWEGVALTAVGMTTVFAFLGLLVGLMHGSAAFFEAFSDRFPVIVDPEATPRRSGGAGQDEDIAVVLAAIEAHRRQAGQKTRGN